MSESSARPRVAALVAQCRKLLSERGEAFRHLPADDCAALVKFLKSIQARVIIAYSQF
jgi:hypothetical protein